MTAYATHDEIHDAIFALLETGHAVVITLAPDAHIRVQINKACCNRMKADGIGIDIGSALADAIDNLNRQP
jgi:hypothetical protein